MSKKIVSLVCLAFALALVLTLTAPAGAHFGMVIPDKPAVSQPGTVELELLFWHPRENHGMDLTKPSKVGVSLLGEKQDLSPSLKAAKKDGKAIWRVKHQIKRPGDYIYFMEPAPYFEPAEDVFIIHYTKAVVPAMGAEEGWDLPAGLPVEILPLTRPYGLNAGNSFTGQVLYLGKPLAGAGVEIELYDPKGKHKIPSDAHITQVVKTDPNGIFCFTMPWSGWWGFSALTTADYKMKYKGVKKDVELGGVLWVFVD